MNRPLGLLICLALSCHLQAQVPSFNPKKHKANVQFISFSLHAPIDAFAKSHIAGAGLSYTWTRIAYKRSMPKKISFTTLGGIDYYLGKKKEIAAHNFTYGGYWYVYAQAGASADIASKAAIMLTAGPAMGIYKGTADFGVSSSLFGVFYIRTRLLAGPGITFKKHNDVNALWTIAARVSYAF